MRKMLSIFVVLLFIISVIPVFAEESTDTTSTTAADTTNRATTTATDTTTTAADTSEPQPLVAKPRIRQVNQDIRQERQEVRQNIKETKESRQELNEDLKARRQAAVASIQEKPTFKNLDEERLNKLATLKKANAEKLTNLRQEQIQRLTQVKADRLRVMAQNLDQEKLQKIASLDQKQLEKLASLDRERLKEYANLKPAELKEKLAKLNVTKVDPSMAFKKRVIAKEELEDRVARYKEVKEKYDELKTGFKTERVEFVKAKQAGDEEAALTHAKMYLSNSANLAIKTLEKILIKAKSNDDLSEEEITEMGRDIDAKIIEMQNAKAKVEAATTRDELKEAGKVIINVWNKAKVRARIHTAKLVQANVGEILSRSEQLEKRLDTVLANMEEQGIEVADIDAKVDEFSAKIATARDKLKESKELFANAKAANDTSLVQKSRAVAKDAHTALKEAHNILKEIIRDIRAAGGSVEEVESTQPEEIEVVETEPVIEQTSATVPVETTATESATSGGASPSTATA